MKRSIMATFLFTAIAAHVAAGEEDLATQIRALQKERVETLTRLVNVYTLQHKAGAISADVLAGAETALVDAQLEAADKPGAATAILTEALKREHNAFEVATRQAPDSRPLDVYDNTDQELLLSVISQMTIRFGQAENARLARADKGETVSTTWKQEAPLENLTRLVEKYRERYKTGTVPLEALAKAEVALLDARMVAAGKHEERVALLEEGAKREAELLKVAESKCKASACSARSLFLGTKIRILRERSAKDHAAQIKAAQKERVQALTELVKIDTELWKTDWTGLATLTQARADLANAQVDAADTSEAKVLVLTQAAKEQAEVVRFLEVRVRVGYKTTHADVYRERLHLLNYKIRLLRERGLPKARNQ